LDAKTLLQPAICGSSASISLILALRRCSPFSGPAWSFPTPSWNGCAALPSGSGWNLATLHLRNYCSGYLRLKIFILGLQLISKRINISEDNNMYVPVSLAADERSNPERAYPVIESIQRLSNRFIAEVQ